MKPLELAGTADDREEANWSGASYYFREAQQIAFDRIARSRTLLPSEKLEWLSRMAAAFAEIQRAFTGTRLVGSVIGTYDMKNAMLTACRYASGGRKAMPLEDVEANLRHLASLLQGRVHVPHPSEHPNAVDEGRRRSLKAD